MWFTELFLVQLGAVTATNENPSQWPRLMGFPCMATDVDLVLAREFGGDPTFQNLRCFFPAVTMNFVSSEKLTDAKAGYCEEALIFVIKILLLQSQRQIYPSRGNPMEARHFPRRIEMSHIENDRRGLSRRKQIEGKRSNWHAQTNRQVKEQCMPHHIDVLLAHVLNWRLCHPIPILQVGGLTEMPHNGKII